MNTKISFYFITLILSFSKIILVCDAKVLPYEAYAPLSDVIHSCRQKCISEILADSKFNGQLKTYFRCRGTPNCYMCWDYCRAVSVAQVDLARSMCGDNKYCSKGCKVACNFFRITSFYNVIENLT